MGFHYKRFNSFPRNIENNLSLGDFAHDVVVDRDREHPEYKSGSLGSGSGSASGSGSSQIAQTNAESRHTDLWLTHNTMEGNGASAGNSSSSGFDRGAVSANPFGGVGGTGAGAEGFYSHMDPRLLTSIDNPYLSDRSHDPHVLPQQQQMAVGTVVGGNPRTHSLSFGSLDDANCYRDLFDFLVSDDESGPDFSTFAEPTVRFNTPEKDVGEGGPEE